MKEITLSTLHTCSIKRAKEAMYHLKNIEYSTLLDRTSFTNKKVNLYIFKAFQGWKKQYPGLYFIKSNFINLYSKKKKLQFKSRANIGILIKTKIILKFTVLINNTN